MKEFEEPDTNVDVAGQGGQSVKSNVCEHIAEVRAEIDAAFEAARRRAEGQAGGKHAQALRQSRQQARDMLHRSRAKTSSLLGELRGETEPVTGPTLTLRDLHTTERLASHVRHSIVRVCFYNLKLFCPSLVDEFDEYVKEQVILNIDQLEDARAEIRQFYDQKMSGGETVGMIFNDSRRTALARLDELIRFARGARDKLNTQEQREAFARRVPELIDSTMAALQNVQEKLDERKVAVGDLVEKAVQLTRNFAEQNGMSIKLDTQPGPKVFGEPALLANGFCELITNAAKHAQADKLAISVKPASKDNQYIVVSFADNGRGMTKEDVKTCTQRGVSTKGTGEGIPMVKTIVEQEHLGRVNIEAKPRKGCRVDLWLPVKLDLRAGRQLAHD